MKKIEINLTQQNKLIFEIDADKHLMFVDWRCTNITAEDGIIGMDHIFDLMIKYDISLLFNDNRNQIGGFDFPEVMEYMNSQWIPKLISNGLRKFAHIISPDLDTKLSTFKLNQITKEFVVKEKDESEIGLEYIMFKDSDVALDWLKSPIFA